MNTVSTSEPPAASQPKSAGGYLFIPKALKRGAFLKWLRRLHAWFGFWIATLALLFGLSGLLLNHREIMKIPAAKTAQQELQLPLPEPKPADAKAMAAWLGNTLHIDTRHTRIKQEKSKPVPWNGGEVVQPPLWQINLRGPKRSIQAEYWQGNSYVSIKQSEANFFALLTNLHRGMGMGPGWILFTDSLAVGMMMLSLTGILLWTGLHGRRVLAAGLGLTSLGLLLWQALRSVV